MRTVNEQIKDVENGLECCLKQEGSCIEHGCKYYTDDLKVDCCAELCKDAVLLIDNLAAMEKPAEGLWIYCPDDEGRPRWKCSRCGKIVHRDPAKKTVLLPLRTAQQEGGVNVYTRHLRLAHCKSCGAAIYFIPTSSGNSIPCNAEALPYWQTKGGSKKIVTPNGEVLSAELEGLPGMETGLGYITHFATCPDASKFRKR